MAEAASGGDEAGAAFVLPGADKTMAVYVQSILIKILKYKG